MDMSEAIAVISLDFKFFKYALIPGLFYEMLQSARSAFGGEASGRYNLTTFYHPHQDSAGKVSAPLPNTLILANRLVAQCQKSSVRRGEVCRCRYTVLLYHAS